MTSSAIAAFTASVEHLFHGAFEDVVTCSVDEWIKAWVDEADTGSHVQEGNFHRYHLLEM